MQLTALGSMQMPLAMCAKHVRNLPSSARLAASSAGDAADVAAEGLPEPRWGEGVRLLVACPIGGFGS